MSNNYVKLVAFVYDSMCVYSLLSPSMSKHFAFHQSRLKWIMILV